MTLISNGVNICNEITPNDIISETWRFHREGAPRDINSAPLLFNFESGEKHVAIVEDLGANSAPLVISYINKSCNAEQICEILNCDYLGEVYTPKKATRLFNCSIQRFEKDKKLKTPENEGERS